MTNKDYDTIKDRMMDLVQNGTPDVAWTAAKTITDITIALEELKMRQEHTQQLQDRPYHQSGGEEKCSCKDVPASGGCVVSQYCNNELIHRLIKEFKTGELVNPLAKDSDVVRALRAGVCCACISSAKDPTLLEAAIVEGHYVALICGGNNGDGTWSVYLDQISSIIYSLEEQGYKAWLIRLDNDCPDDVWYAYIGFEDSEERRKDCEV